MEATVQTRKTPTGIEYTVVTSEELAELDVTTANTLSSMPADMETIVGVVMLAKGAPLDQLTAAFDTVVIDRNQTYGTWFSSPPHVVVAWSYHARVELDNGGKDGVVVYAQPILSVEERGYHLRDYLEDLVIIRTGDNCPCEEITRIMRGQRPSMYASPHVTADHS